MSLTPNALALQYKDALNQSGAFVVQPDGSVKMSADRGGGYAPPWVWAGAIPPASGNDPQSQALRIKLSTPGSDPSSPWHSMYSEGGPFTHHSAWDSSKGTYEGGIDWGTLLGTIGVGGLFAAPAIGAALGGSAAAGGASVGPMAGAETGMAATSAALAPPASIAAGGSSVGIGSALGGIGKKVAGDAASNVVNNVTGGSAPSGGSRTAEAMALISGLLAGQLLKSHGAQNSVPPQLSQMLDLGTQRAMAQQPMFNAVNQGTFAMLPDFAKQGVTPPSPMTFTPSTPPPGGDSGGGMNPMLLALLSGAGGMGLGGALTGTNPYGAIVDGLKKLFQGRGSSPSGGAGSSPYQVVGPPDPDDPWNGDPSQFGGG